MLVATLRLEVQKKCTQAGLKVTLAGISFLGFLAVNEIEEKKKRLRTVLSLHLPECKENDINKNIQMQRYLDIQENIMAMEVNEKWNFKKV